MKPTVGDKTLRDAMEGADSDPDQRHSASLPIRT